MTIIQILILEWINVCKQFIKDYQSLHKWSEQQYLYLIWRGIVVYHVLCAIAYLRLAKLQQMYRFPQYLVDNFWPFFEWHTGHGTLQGEWGQHYIYSYNTLLTVIYPPHPPGIIGSDIPNTTYYIYPSQINK